MLQQLKQRKIFENLWSESRVYKKQQLWQLSGRYQTLNWRPGDRVQNLESPGLAGRVDSTAVVIRRQGKYILFFKKRNINQTFKLFWPAVACENIRFSSLFTTGDVSRGGTSATQRQKLHADDAIQCLHYKSSSHGVPNINLSNFMCLLVDFGKVLCPYANELLQNSNASSREDLIFHKY